MFLSFNEKVFAAEDAVINANSNGEPRDVYYENTYNEDTGELIAVTAKQYTRTRDITITLNQDAINLENDGGAKYEDFIVCEVLYIEEDEQQIIEHKDNCTKFPVSEKNLNYQIKSENDGEKQIVLIFNYEGKTQWTQEDDIIVKKITLDTMGPVITLNGGEYVFVPSGNTYEEQEATCEDDSGVATEGGCKVTIEETTIDMKKTGFQYIRYTATDFLGNETNVLRKVMVEVVEDKGGIDLYWYFAIGFLVIVVLSLGYIVIKNKDKQKNQSVL